MTHSPWLPKRKKGLRKTGIRRKPRPPEETERIYGSPERREWIKSLPCGFVIVCRSFSGVTIGHCVPPILNCHTVNDGRGRKGHYSTIVPGCDRHHTMYDQYQGPFGRDSAIREAVKNFAGLIESAWQERSGI